MALMKCEECGKKISTEAVSCPNCGGPAPKDRTGETITAKESSDMTYKQRRIFQKAGGKILLSKMQKFSFSMLAIFVVVGLSKCGNEKNSPVTDSEKLGSALEQLDTAMKDPRKVRLLECEGINVWDAKPVGWKAPNKMNARS